MVKEALDEAYPRSPDEEGMASADFMEELIELIIKNKNILGDKAQSYGEKYWRGKTSEKIEGMITSIERMIQKG